MSIPGKHVQNGVYEFSYMRAPDTRSQWEVLQDAFYNPKNGTILGHTKREWGRTGLFYLVFFSVLAVFFAVCMKGLLATLNEDKPTYVLGNSIIGTSPGMGYRPLPGNSDKEMIISYDSKNETDIDSWIKRINTFLESYHNSSLLPGNGRNQQVCDYDHPPRTGKVCMFDVRNLGPCSYDKGYGFVHSQPCIFIKLNKIFGWIPNYYNKSKEFPSHMPESVKSHIEKNLNSGRSKNVWVSCHAVKQSETLIDQVKYYPEMQGFPGYYYPYENQKGYLSPLVAVQFIAFKRYTSSPPCCKKAARALMHCWRDRMQTTGSVDRQ